MDDTSNLILEHLRHIRAKVDQTADDVSVLKARMTSVESQLAGLHTDMAILHKRGDGVDARLERIERRLDLAETGSP